MRAYDACLRRVLTTRRAVSPNNVFAMHIALLFPTLPPALDGIGDYTVRLATTLAPEHTVSVWTTDVKATPIPNVTVRRGVSFKTRTGATSMAAAARLDTPDWVVLQYNPFSYGPRGLNLSLAPALRQVKSASPRTRVAVMVHEPFVPVISWRWAILTTWQRWQLWHLGRVADVLFFSIAPWADRFQSWFPRTPVQHLPVGSNIPRTPASRMHVRERCGLPPEAMVLGIFGTAHHSRRLPYIARAARAATHAGHRPHVLYVGPHGEAVRRHLGAVPVHDAGRLAAPDVSRHFAAMDVYLSPFEEGVSSRRGSFLAGIQHGVATATTQGAHTDAFMRDAHGSAFVLTPDGTPDAFVDATLRLIRDPNRRQQIAVGGRCFYDAHFDWSLIAAQMLRAFNRVDAPRLHAA
jgi:glycosyltransferase involved in cell wall biosynthesis